MRFLLLVVVLSTAAILNGCDNQTHADVAASTVSHDAARPAPKTDPGDAVGIATALLRQEGFGEDEYPFAGASFDDERGEWRVVFPHVPLRDDLDDVTVVVNDDDQTAQLVTE